MIACEKIETVRWYTNENLMTCTMLTFSSIKTPNLRFSSSDDSVTAVNFENNKAIEYLPLDIYENFPDLTWIQACWCSIKSIDKENFQSLKKLRKLNLHHNKIVQISDHTFEGLEALKELNLGE